MADTLLTLDLPPGMRRTGTVYQSKDQWYSGNLVRFFQDTIRPVGGWTARSTGGDALTGIPRAMISYRLNDSTQIIVMGTTAGLFAMNSATQTMTGDTPASAGTETGIAALTSVTTVDPPAGSVNPTPITLFNEDSSDGAHKFQLITEPPGSGVLSFALDVRKFGTRTNAAIGFNVSLNSVEYDGAGGEVQVRLDTGTIISSTLVNAEADWATAPTVTDMGDGWYRVAFAFQYDAAYPAPTLTVGAVEIELLDDPTGLNTTPTYQGVPGSGAYLHGLDIDPTDWLTGLPVVGGNPIILSAGSVEYTLVTDITPSEVTSNDAARMWQLDVFGAYLVAVDLIAPNTAGAAYYWTGDMGTTAEIISPFTGTTPTSAVSVVGTPERHLVMLGGLYTASGWSATGVVPRSRMVTWATQEGGFTGSDWVPGAANTAGDFALTTDGALVCGRRSRGATLLWTTTDLWTMTYIGGTFVYRFDQVGNKCGIISSQAAVVTDAAAYWMGYNGFYAFDGFVKPIPCAVHDYIFGDLNRDYAYLIWAVENPTFGEVTWFYPSSDATEIDRYVTLNPAEGHWSIGELSRTAGIAYEPGVTPYPVMADVDRTIWNHESGFNRHGEGVPSLESGPLELGDGDRVVSVLRVIPDDLTAGDVSLTLYAGEYPDAAETTHGPYTMSAKTDVRVSARQVRVKLTDATDETDWRVGKIRLGVVPAGRR